MSKNLYLKLKKLLWKEQWNVALLEMSPENVASGKLEEIDFEWLLPERKGGYYADPFVFVKDGQVHVFVEEYEADEAKGKISFFEVRKNGEKFVCSEPKTIIETEHHLSYPFVFEHENEIYMLPECSASGEVALYRATEFPSKWVKERVFLNVP